MKRKNFIIIFLLLLFITGCKKHTPTYTISFDIDGVIASKEYKAGESVEFPSATKDDFEFIGWSLDGSIVTSYIVTSKDLTFVAVFEKNDYLSDTASYLDTLIPTIVTKNLNLPTEYSGVNISWTTTKPSTISRTGEVTVGEVDVNVTLVAKLSYENKELSKEYQVTVPKLSDEVILNNVLAKYEFNDKISDNKVTLKTNFSTTNSKITSKWESSHPELMDDKGNLLSYPKEDTVITLTLTLTLRETIETREYQVSLDGKTVEELLTIAIETANIETNVVDRIVNLPTDFAFNIVGIWESSDENVLTNDGVVKVFNEQKSVKMTLTYWFDGENDMKEKEFEFNVNVDTAMRVVRADSFNANNMTNVELKDNKLILKDGQISGEYESDVIETLSFKSLVGSWAAISSTTATVEFQVKVRVNGTWSDYITYCSGGWGLGLQNAAKNQTNSLIKLSTDEVIVLNSKTANAAQFKLILRRNSSAEESPKVSLVALALEGSNYSGLSYSLDELPANVKYIVPKLYQQVVPTIGNSICSATSTTMLLKYKGLSFTNYDSEYEHRYMAGIVRDYGNNIYGNWVYNCVAMGGYGFDSYVARLYSANELAYHIATVGPVAISVKGQMTSNLKDYYTSGHLLCIIGYTYENGVLTFIANDPNVSQVECTYSLSVINNTWRNIVYVIE